RVLFRSGGAEVFSLLIDTEHRNTGASVRFSQAVGNHELLVGLNRAESDVTGGHYRNLRGRPNGLREHVANSAELTEAFVMDRWRVRDGLTLVLGGQASIAERDVRITSASTGAVRAPSARYERFSPRTGFLLGVDENVTLYGNISGLF